MSFSSLARSFTENGILHTDGLFVPVACPLLQISFLPVRIHNVSQRGWHCLNGAFLCQKKAQRSMWDEKLMKREWTWPYFCFKKTLNIALSFSTQFRSLTSGRTIHLTELSTALITLLLLEMKFSWNSSELKIKRREALRKLSIWILFFFNSKVVFHSLYLLHCSSPSLTYSPALKF